MLKKGERIKDEGRDRGGGRLVFVIRGGRSAVFVVGERLWT
jgi:hypothetical protein